MKAFWFTALLLLGSLATRAQVYYLDLRHELLPVADRSFRVEQVVDGRPNHPAIGIVYRGLGNKAAAVLFREGLEPELTAFLQAHLPPRPTDQPVVLCVRQLRVSEAMSQVQETATADLALDLYLHLPDGYHFVQSATSYTKALGLKTTRLHAEHVALLLTRCLNQLAQANWLAAAHQPALTLAQLPTDVPAPLAGHQAAAILREAPRRGIYRSFKQFLANQPDTSLAFRVDTVARRYRSPLADEKWVGVAHVRPVATTPARRPAELPNVWGFCDGYQVFVQHGQHYFPLARQGSFFTFVGEAPLDVEYVHARTVAQARTMVAPVAFVGLPDHTSEPVAYALDMQTGEASRYPGLNLTPRADSAFIYVYMPSRAVSQKITVFMNGQAAGALQPGEYLQLVWARPTQLLQLWLGGWPGHYPCQYLVPNTARYNYLKLDPAAPYSSQWMLPKQGEADLDALDQLRK